jgi:DNA-binding NarL/FixJ family response regulator
VDQLSSPIRVVVADDHSIWRAGVRADLGDEFVVVGEAADARAAVVQITATRPDLVLCDLHMPEGGGLHVVRECATIVPVVILTVSDDERDVLDAVAAGAVGYLLKSTGGADLRDALRRVAAGEPVFSPALAASVLAEFRRLRTADVATDGLSNREREVLRCVARGLSYREVGEELFIAAKTVENHTRNIMAKLHLSRRNELIRWAIRHDLDS